jgi:eukaryotic-like serine/threonine-protein kinase
LRALQRQPNPQAEEALTRLGKYDLIACVGRGDLARVHLARLRGENASKKVLVVKTLAPDLADREDLVKAFLEDHRVAAVIEHPQGVAILEVDRVDRTAFVVTEYVDGMPLTAIISAGERGQPLDVIDCARIVASAAEGLHAAHDLKTLSGRSLELVHGNVSPSNVIVPYAGRAKIADFGMGKVRPLGKDGYRSPEQLLGKPVDRRSDVFSLGIVLWEALALRRLFAGETTEATVARIRNADIPPPSAYRPQIPPDLDEVCLWALRMHPTDRYQSAGELEEALERVIGRFGSPVDTEALPKYMARVFARQRKERDILLRTRAVTTGEVEQLARPIVQAVPQAALPPQPVRPGPELLKTVPPRRRGWGGVLALTIVVLGTFGAVGFTQRSKTSSAGAERVERARPAASRVDKSTRASAAAPQPGRSTPSREVEEPEPEPEPLAEAEQIRHNKPRPVPRREPARSAPAPAPAPEPTPAASPARSADELHAEAAELFVQGKAEEAAKRFQQALALNPRHAASHRGLGLAYQALGRKEKAIQEFETYLRLRPDAGDAQMIRSRLDQLK